MCEIYSEKFGFLNVRESFEFDAVSIVPVSNYEESLHDMRKVTHHDGFRYPPVTKSFTGHYDKVKKCIVRDKEIPNSKRPIQYYNIPASHIINIQNPVNTELKFGDAGLIIHLLAYLYGTRLQFVDWGVDGRVSITKSLGDIGSDAIGFHKQANTFLSFTYVRWKIWEEKPQLLFVNILYMHTRALSIETEWEAFMSHYMVFDALYKLHVRLGRLAFEGHTSRLRGMRKFYNLLEPDEPLLTKISNVRNELFHEALWMGNVPGHKSSEGECFWLSRLNARLIVAVTGYENSYVKSNWWTFGDEVFD